ncbi:MAG: hypothetical protein K2M94_02870 [Paramuribaculum sp.]|nr:hypothetical protein [Paramuribaculum sp.]
MNLREILSVRIGRREISAICSSCMSSTDYSLREDLFSLIDDSDNRTGYNALWILTHLSVYETKWLKSKRDILIDRLLGETHTGKRRLILTLLEALDTEESDVRTDYLDFCLSRINSVEPYGVRALCLKQAYAQCKFYPELLQELKAEIEMMDSGVMSPGIVSARKNILKRILKQ